MKKFLVICHQWMILNLLLLAGVASAWGQADVQFELSKETNPKVSIAVQQFVIKQGADSAGVGSQGRSILENDLRISEFFDPVNPSKFQDLAQLTHGTSNIDFPSWNSRGIQWMIKSEFAVNPGGTTYTFVFRLYDIVNERFLIGKRYRGTRSYLRRIIHRFADEVIAQLTGKRGVMETRLAYVMPSGKNKELYVVDFDGYNARRVTYDNSVVLTPAWSPDSRFLLFTSYKEHNPDLVMIGANGQNRRTLLKLPGLNAAPSWSPDGKKIALTLSKDLNAEIYLLDRRTKLKRLTRHFNIDTSPTWSPNGKKIAFTSDRSGTAAPQIFIMDADDGDEGRVKRITFDSSYNDDPAWSPDGDQIAYTSRVGRMFRIKIYNLKTRETTLLTQGGGSQEKPAWSPDGRYIAYSQKLGGRTQIYIKRVGGGPPRILGGTSGAISPAWSPYSK